MRTCHLCDTIADTMLTIYLSGTRLAVSVRGDEPYEELEILKNIDATMLLHDLPYTEDKISRVHAARRYNVIDSSKRC